MLQFDVNISILLKEVPLVERFERAASLGFGAVEFWWPGDENLAAVAEQVQATGLKVALMNFDAGNMAGGERGFLNDPARQQWFRSHVPQALDFAATIGCPRLNAIPVAPNLNIDETERSNPETRRNAEYSGHLAR